MSQPTPLQLQPSRRRPVVPAFLLAAFLIDLVVVYFVGYSLQLAGERVLLDPSALGSRF